MTTESFARNLAKKLNWPKTKCDQLVKAWAESITSALIEGEEVYFSSFGTFFLVHYPAKTILDPQGRGTKITMLPTNVAKFRPSEQLKKKTVKIVNWEKSKISDLKESREKIVEKIEPAKNEEKIEKVDKPTSSTISYYPKNFGTKQVNIEFKDLEGIKVDKEILNLIPQNIAKRYQLAPVELESGRLVVAMVDPENINAVELLKKTTQLEIQPVLSTSAEISQILDQYTMLQEEVEDVIAHSDLGITNQEIKQAEKEKIEEEEIANSPTIRIVFSLLKRAVRERASDVHIEPQETDVIVRFRIDGILQKRVLLPRAIHPSIIARLKIMANLKIDEQRLPQDGRFQLDIDKQEIDFRFSTMPCVNGEKAVMRILDKSQGILTLEEIGVSGHGFDVLSANVKKSHGMTLVTGPTGSGKTTTLYALLSKLMNTTVNIVTLEDPVEYRIPEINQSQMNSEIGYSFATSLRTVVRQDPDIIMLGEIRDQETAEMAIHAALTGHIVLSTLHTNDAAGAVPRLIDMGVEPFLISSSVNTVVAQRLTRRLCPHCRIEVQLSDLEMKDILAEIDRMPKSVKQGINLRDLHFFGPKGCDSCNNVGYKGRQGVFEVLDISDSIQDLIISKSTSNKIQEQAIAEEMVTMLQDGILKALSGITSITEVWRVTRE